jgi:maleylpyruvate isomerase
MKLYGYWRSSCAYRVRIALALKGVPYELVVVNLLAKEQQAEGFMEKNPSAQVPVLEVERDGRVHELGQSVAILEYLEEQFPEPPLLPKDPIARARARQLTEVVASGIQPLQNLFVTRLLQHEHGIDPKPWCVLHIERGLAAYERIAKDTAGAFSVGDAPSFADCALVPQLFNARRFGVDVEAAFPLLARIDARCAEIGAFAAAHPDRQPDALPNP